MNEIEELESEIIELELELKKWEEYNQIENDILREEIEQKKELLKKYKEINEMFK